MRGQTNHCKQVFAVLDHIVTWTMLHSGPASSLTGHASYDKSPAQLQKDSSKIKSSFDEDMAVCLSNICYDSNSRLGRNGHNIKRKEQDVYVGTITTLAIATSSLRHRCKSQIGNPMAQEPQLISTNMCKHRHQ